MSEKDLRNSPRGGIVERALQSSKIRGQAIHIKTHRNLKQYIDTINAYSKVKELSYEDIALAGEYIGDEVVRSAVDAPMEAGWETKEGEIACSDTEVLAWRRRGETVTATPQLSDPSSVSGTEVIHISENPTVQQSTQVTLEVVEGIGVSQTETPQLSGNSLPKSPDFDAQRESNPFFQVVGDIDYEKAA